MAVATFEVQGGVTPEEAGVVTELFIASLVNTGRVNVIDRTNFEKILEEMRFQTSDWSSPNTTAELGRVINVQNVIRGQLMKLDNNIFWTATVLDVNTAQVLSSSRQQINNINDVWGNTLTNFSNQIISQLPPPNYFVGRWQYSDTYPSSQTWRDRDNDRSVGGRNIPVNPMTIILTIQADGNVIVERFDTIEVTINSTERSDLDLWWNTRDHRKPRKYSTLYDYGSLNMNGRGTGNYNGVTRNNSDLSTNINLNLRGIISQIPSTQRASATISLNSTNTLTITGLLNAYITRQSQGRTRSQRADFLETHAHYNDNYTIKTNFTRIN
jgi:TolB-like protein